ncbi:BrnA antitoxin family protein [Labrys wisconsinensis]|uniref:Uncharacterized protein (DUF4415 family) n=1 Tax=Labrys wisconsinensis TaxID=425677 RepID=A0ABU0JFW5_9HYPH|nr:BrnA antitoxin family protein [Labrys wisconsinensis]MDQ0473182.1 uncharacterized protein (DUF4415 family) [Labrys wisconsinensis]
MATGRTRRPQDPFAAAQAVFSPAPAPRPPEPQRAAVPVVKETVTLRIDSDVLAVFQEDGPGWQDRINAALRKATGL